MKSRVSPGRMVLIWIMCSWGVSAAAQQLPSSDIYLVGMHEGRVDTTVYALKNITDRPGFDNHPAFNNNGSALVYVTDQTGSSIDIYRYNIGRGNRLQMSYSSEVNEYSPKPLPVRGYSAIVEETVGKLRLWNLSADALTGDPVLPFVTSVGSYEWIDDDRVALYIIGDPITLQIADVKTGQLNVVASNIGRTLSRIPGSTDVSFLHKESDKDWVIKKLDPDTGMFTEIAPTIGDGEDFAWTVDGRLMMASGSVVYEWEPSLGKWDEFYDFSDAGLNYISRMAFSPEGDMLAFVLAR